ncbi:antitermination protein [Roseibium denhamense]|uniref:Antitermination protein n=1 Tax=Roseibium denhamense TaxID=76305 RepID=A0ABY1N7G1_9HYPH|nr:antitermination protein [Roseibium denhamense]MTI06010.1 antitermination protein [Roseibium denhamense]SMP02086.1 hypothetical protein SAMN06265374_0425 [Roseibium denhamense]
MNKIAVTSLTIGLLALTGGTFALSGNTNSDNSLRRVDCHAITMFTPSKAKSAEELCENYGGVAERNAEPSKQGLVILVRNQRYGGFEGDAQ